MSRRRILLISFVAATVLALTSALTVLAQQGPATRPSAAGRSAPLPKHAHEPGDTYFTCPMHPEVHEHEDGRCPICNMNLVERTVESGAAQRAPASKPPPPTQKPKRGPAQTPVASTPAAATAPTTPEPGDEDVEYWTCSMHPHVHEAEAGTCPVCGMNLTPVTKGDLRTGIVTVDAVRRQMIGVRTAAVQRRNLTHTIRALGRVELDETRIVDVTLQTSGWVEGLRVKRTGQLVKRGQTLLTLYSPQVVAAGEELLLAAQAKAGATSETARARTNAMQRAARGKLRTLGLAPWQIDSLLKAGAVPRVFAVVAPSSGYVVAKDVVEGAHVPTGTRVFRIVPLDRVWVDAAVYAKDLPLVAVGQPVTARPKHTPEVPGVIEWVYPDVDPRTQTGRVRVVIDNPDLALRPGMFVDVDLQVDLGERLVVPSSAVVFTGKTRLVFVDLGEGKLVPVPIKVGLQTPTGYEVLAGLSAGQTVVTSGVFLIAAESRIRSAAGYWGAADVSD